MVNEPDPVPPDPFSHTSLIPGSWVLSPGIRLGVGEGGGGRPDSVSHTSRIRDSWVLSPGSGLLVWGKGSGSHTSRIRDSWVLSPGSGLLVWGSAEAGARCTKHGLRVRSLSNYKTFEHDANFLTLYIVCIIYILSSFVLCSCCVYKLVFIIEHYGVANNAWVYFVSSRSNCNTFGEVLIQESQSPDMIQSTSL